MQADVYYLGILYLKYTLRQRGTVNGTLSLSECLPVTNNFRVSMKSPINHT